MSRRYFGTDGVRGVANSELTVEFAQRLGMSVGRWIREHHKTGRVVIGRDTRRSGALLEAALTSGLAAVGIDVVTVGIAPTPAVSYLARTQGFTFGVIISASHNPAPDNGIKFVTSAGTKSTDEMELQWEAWLETTDEWMPAYRVIGGEVGQVTADETLVAAYRDFLIGVVPEGLAGMRIAVDGAHGAAYAIGPDVLRALGADVVVMGDRPDGMNINAEGGATKPQTIQDFTVAERADVGVAFDGDADRAVFSDGQGRLINGDRTIGIWAAHHQATGELNPPTVVGTVMSNGGFESYLTSLGILLERTPVGDKYVSKRIQDTGALVGGEQSGHIVFPRRQPSGDGILTALELFRVLKQADRPASAFVADYEPWPQLLVNVGVASTAGWQDSIAQELAEGETKLGTKGRVLVRPSGTQPMIRVMVEAETYELRDEVADAIVDAMTSRMGGHVHGRVDLTHALGD